MKLQVLLLRTPMFPNTFGMQTLFRAPDPSFLARYFDPRAHEAPRSPSRRKTSALGESGNRRHRSSLHCLLDHEKSRRSSALGAKSFAILTKDFQHSATCLDRYLSAIAQAFREEIDPTFVVPRLAQRVQLACSP